MSIPRKITTYTPYRLPRPGRLTVTFTEKESALIISNCRKQGVSFGASFLVLGQLGSSRLLHRRYIRGEIGKEEWEWRRIQPCNTLGPLNYRPYLDKDWYAKGGSEVVAFCISFFFLTHSFMPSVSDEWIAKNQHNLEEGAPPFTALLSQGRFILRSNAIKQRFKRIMIHPLFFEIANSRLPSRIPHRKQAGTIWRRIGEGAELDEPERHVPSVLTDDLVYHHSGSSLGNVSTESLAFNIKADHGPRQIDPLRPTRYPLHPSNPLSSQKYYPQPTVDEGLSASEPIIRVIDSWMKLCPRPGELYLGSITQNNRLSIYVSWDRNVYDDDLIEEWLNEIKSGTLHYLCQPL